MKDCIEQYTPSNKTLDEEVRKNILPPDKLKLDESGDSFKVSDLCHIKYLPWFISSITQGGDAWFFTTPHHIVRIGDKVGGLLSSIRENYLTRKKTLLNTQAVDACLKELTEIKGN